MNERDYQKKLVEFLRKRSALVFNFIGNIYLKDIPDIFVAHPWFTGWLELKVKDNELTKGQVHNLTELRRRHSKSYVVRFYEDQIVLQNPVGDWSRRFSSIEELWEGLTGE